MVKSTNKKNKLKAHVRSPDNLDADYAIGSRVLKLDELERIEIDQRIKIKSKVVILGIMALIFMSFILIYLLVTVSDKESSWSSSAPIIASIASVTTITVMFFVGAFKNTGGKDSEDTGKTIASSLATIANFVTKGNGV